jgi:hypothetical protein
MNRIECEDLVAWIVQLSPRSIPDGQLATEDAVDKLVDVWLEALGDFTLVEAKRAALKHQNTSQYPVTRWRYPLPRHPRSPLTSGRGMDVRGGLIMSETATTPASRPHR